MKNVFKALLGVAACCLVMGQAEAFKLKVKEGDVQDSLRNLYVGYRVVSGQKEAYYTDSSDQACQFCEEAITGSSQVMLKITDGQWKDKYLNCGLGAPGYGSYSWGFRFDKKETIDATTYQYNREGHGIFFPFTITFQQAE
jgi:hypothetical protein